MVIPRILQGERDRDLVWWHTGPAWLEMRDDALAVVRPDAGPDTPFADVAVDLVVFLGDEGLLVALRRDRHGIDVIERDMDGARHVWRAPVPNQCSADWSIEDVVEGRADDGGRTLVLTVADDSGPPSLWEISRGSATRSTPLRFDELLYWDRCADVAVYRGSDDPEPPSLRLVRPSDGSSVATLPGRWRDGWHGTGLVEAPDRGLEVWDLAAGRKRRDIPVDGYLSDARLLRDDVGRVAVVASRDGVDRLTLDLPEQKVPLAGGRIRICVAHTGGLGLHSWSTLGASTWGWLGTDGRLRTTPGAIPRYEAPAEFRHIVRAGTPTLVFRPPEPSAAVLSLHGGPDTFERDELRWNGAYRTFLRRGLAVVAVNYAGSVGYGDAHQRRGWRSWHDSIAAELDECVRLVAEMGVPIDRTVLLGGSFGASLALLYAPRAARLAGVVACTPLVDLTAHVGRALGADARYADWFAERFDGCAETFEPGRLTDTGPVPVIVVQGDADAVIPVHEVRAMAQQAVSTGRPWRLVEEPGARHTPQTPEQAEARHDSIVRAVTTLLRDADERREREAAPAGRPAVAS